MPMLMIPLNRRPRVSHYWVMDNPEVAASTHTHTHTGAL